MDEDAGPIFRQIATQLEDTIVDGSLPEESQAPSSNELAAFHRITPATAAKRLNQLVPVSPTRRPFGVPDCSYPC